MTRNHFLRTLMIVVSAMCVSQSVQIAQAQEIQITGPLKDAPAVRNMRIHREGRFQLQPMVGFTLQDQYSRTILLGGQLNYHLWDWLAIGVWGGYGLVHVDTALTDEVKARGQTTERNVLSLPSADDFPKQIGQIQWVAALQATFIPLRGKLSLFQDAVLDTDFYVFGGVAAVGVEERADVSSACISQPDLCRNSQSERASRVAVAPTFGAGLMLYTSNLLGISFEWRGLPFAWNTSGTDEASSNDDFPDGAIDENDRIFHFNHMVNLGLAFYLPSGKKVTE